MRPFILLAWSCLSPWKWSASFVEWPVDVGRYRVRLGKCHRREEVSRGEGLVHVDEASYTEPAWLHVLEPKAAALGTGRALWRLGTPMKVKEGPGDRAAALPEYPLRYLWPCVDILQIFSLMTSSWKMPGRPLLGHSGSCRHLGHTRTLSLQGSSELCSGRTCWVELSPWKLGGLLAGREFCLSFVAPEERIRTSGGKP